MSSLLPDRLIEDRKLRDAARAVLTEDIDRLRGQLAEQGIASRVSSGVKSTVSGRVQAGARDVLAQARAQADDHKGVLALLVAAIILFLARGPILDWIEQFADTEDDTDPETDTASPEAGAEGDPA
jgi:hypothetical protein